MFLHVSVILSTVGWGWGVLVSTATAADGTHPTGMRFRLKKIGLLCATLYIHFGREGHKTMYAVEKIHNESQLSNTSARPFVRYDNPRNLFEYRK